MPANILTFLSRFGARDERPLTAEPRPLDSELRVGYQERPIQLDLAGRSLRLYPDLPLEPTHKLPKDWVLVDAERYLCGICGFIRIGSGQTVLVGRDNDLLKPLFGGKFALKTKHLCIENDDGNLTFSRLDPEAETTIRLVDDPQEAARPRINRRHNLKLVRDIFGGPFELLSDKEALAALQQVNQLMRDSVYRAKDSEGRPGGLVDLPGELTPIIVGDLHAQIDNLLKILSEDSYLDALCRSQACLILLGDTIHSEADGELEQMHTSLLMLDLIFKLAIRFPGQLIYLRGNHESFDAEVAKSGVPQGILFRKYVREQRGQGYVDELRTFFELMPYVVKSNDFIACHGGPPRGRVDITDMIHVADRPDLAHAFVWNRLRSARDPVGYKKKHVKRLRSALGAGKKTPFIVGHNPLSGDGTLWTDVGNIHDHHIVFSAHRDRIGLFTRVGGQILPFEYPAEPLLAFTNAL